MISLTAIIRAKPGSEDAVLRALLEVGSYVRANEPRTVSYFVTQSADDPRQFVTHERFTDRAAMERHNDGAGSKGFFRATDGLLDGPVQIVVGEERAAK